MIKNIFKYIAIILILFIDVNAQDLTQQERNELAAKLIPIYMLLLEDSTLKITGTPNKSVNVYDLYQFLPHVNKENIIFSIENKPSWLEFNSTTGELKGTPIAEGNFSNIIITAKNDEFTSSLNPFFIEVLPAVFESTTIEKKINVEEDDAAEYSNGSIFTSRHYLDMVQHRTLVQTIGLRFRDLPIPRGMKIESAYLQFEVDTPTSEETNLTIHGEKSPNARYFISLGKNISTYRPHTTASANWSPEAWTSENLRGTAQRSPDLAAIVQEIVDQEGWENKNAMVFIVTGSGKRVAKSFDGDSEGAPSLIVTYTPKDIKHGGVDTDDDGYIDFVDEDDDNDGVLDVDDAFPFDAIESVDTDGDNIGNNADSDDDNDGYSDEDELNEGTDPLDAHSHHPKAPTMIAHIPKYTFKDDNRSFVLKHDQNVTVVSNCGTLSPTSIVANVETAFEFTDFDVGTYEDCNITVTSAEGIVSDPVTLDEFTFFNVIKTTKLRGRSDGKGLDYVIVADGFQEDEMDTFREKAKEFADFVLNNDGNLSLEKNAWNIFTVELISKESGADNVDGKDGTKVDTALDSRFWCQGTSRLLCVSSKKASAVVSKYIPQFDKILVITNSDKYGGAGGSYATTSLGGGKRKDVHELRHSLARLADEYDYGSTKPPSSEPSAANVTINNDKSTVKWSHWLGDHAGKDGNVSLYEGGNYVKEGVWRPTPTSIMRSLYQPFYAVNREAWALAVYHTAGVSYGHTPATVDVNQTQGTDTVFSIEPSMGADAQKIQWQVDDVNQSVPDNNFSFAFGANKNKDYSVKAIISDRTGIIRKDPNNHSKQTIEWQVKVQ